MHSVQLALTSLKREAMAYSPTPAALLSSTVPLYLEMASLPGAAHTEAVVCIIAIVCHRYLMGLLLSFLGPGPWGSAASG